MPALDELAGDPRKNTRARFEQWVKNPGCSANTISAVLNVKLADVAKHLGYEPEYGQSPFAITRGLQFEAWLFKEDARVMREAMVKVKLLNENETGFLDLRLTSNGGSRIKSIEQALLESHNLLKSLYSGNSNNAPSIVAGLLLKIPRGVMLPEATLIIDVCTISRVDGNWQIKVGEIKVFPDRGGFTDPAEIATARAQAGVYQHALELTIRSFSSEGSPTVSKTGFLVFTWPGSNSPVIRANEDLTYQAQRAALGFDRLDAVAVQLGDSQALSDETTNTLDVVAHAETEYKEACWSFCDLAPRCQDMAIERDAAIVLGTNASKVIGKTSVNRAIDLLNGSTPRNEVEADLQRVLQQSDWEIADEY